MSSQIAMVGGCQAVIGYHFSNPDLLCEALQAAGPPVFGIANRPHGLDGNKRLAILGDAVLRLVLVEDWYSGIGTRGHMNETVSFLVSNNHLDTVGRDMHLADFVIKNNCQEGAVPPETMAATVEAILGAVYLDSDIHHVVLVMRTMGFLT